MSSFNTDLKNLFKASLTSNSKTNISNAEKKILNEKKTLFDVNRDGKFNQTDIDMFVKGDIDGDGKVSSDEFNFISKYKDAFTNAMFQNMGKQYKINVENNEISLFDNNNKIKSSRKINEDGTIIDYTYDSKGNKAKAVRYDADGWTANYTYINGLKSTAVKIEKDGTRTEYKYVGGEKATAVRYTYDKNKNITSRKTYAYNSDGKAVAESKITYNYDSSNKLTKSTNYTYINGEAVKTATNEYSYKSDGEYNEIKTKSYNKNGKETSTVTNDYTINTNAEPYVTSSTKGTVINFKNGKEIILNNGETAQINTHEITITTQNGKKYTYSSKGTLLSGDKKTAPKAEKPTLAIDDSKTQKIKDSNGKVIKKIEKDKNGKTLAIIEYTYNSKGIKTGAKKQEYNGNNVSKVAVYTYYDDGKTLKMKNVISDNGETENYEYNPNGTVSKTIITNSQGARYENTYKYKNDGSKIIYREDYTQNNKKRTEIEMTYNKNGIHTGTTRKVYNNTTEKQNRYCNYVYDKNGTKLREEITYYNTKGNKTGNHTVYFTKRADGSYAVS